MQLVELHRVHLQPYVHRRLQGIRLAHLVGIELNGSVLKLRHVLYAYLRYEQFGVRLKVVVRLQSPVFAVKQRICV